MTGLLNLGPRWHLMMNTLAFTVCFAAWMMNGVLVTFLVGQNLYNWNSAQMGWLMGIPVLSGALMRLPLGALTDKYGGRIIFPLLLLVASVAMFMMSLADSYSHFLLASLGFGIAGASFAIGIAYTSVWFPKARQGLALGIFGAGNAGAALTAVGAPILLRSITDNGANLDGWRTLPQLYALALLVTAVLFFLLTRNKAVDHARDRSILQQLSPLKHRQVWRFGLYYFLVFGGFVALSQWLVPYYTNVYAMSLAMAGVLTMMFSFPSGVIRAVGGWMSDKWGARPVMYWILGITLGAAALNMAPPMDIYTPGAGVTASQAGTVTEVTPGEITLSGGQSYQLKTRPDMESFDHDSDNVIFPILTRWHEPLVQIGDEVLRRQVLANGITHIYYQANIWIFVALVFVIGITTGIGKAAVYKYIPDYYPRDVGVVGGLVGLLGALGGFFLPIIFGYILKWTGVWTTAWMIIGLLSLICLVLLNMAARGAKRV
ncbi:MAG: MFS transporter [Dehalococcoidales bacterium]|nr:MFS transporter [Dehalococcoidales bacterium]